MYKAIIALQDKGQELEHIPADLLDEEICLTALNNYKGFIGSSLLKRIPEHLRTKTVCEAAVKVDPSSLELVPNQFRTYEMYLAAASHAFLPDISECPFYVMQDVSLMQSPLHLPPCE